MTPRTLPPTPEGLRKTIKILGILQFAGVLPMVVVCTILATTTPDLWHAQKRLFLAVMAFVAVTQLIAFRFIVIPKLQKQLAAFDDANAGAKNYNP